MAVGMAGKPNNWQRIISNNILILCYRHPFVLRMPVNIILPLSPLSLVRSPTCALFHTKITMTYPTQWERRKRKPTIAWPSSQREWWLVIHRTTKQMLPWRNNARDRQQQHSLPENKKGIDFRQTDRHTHNYIIVTYETANCQENPDITILVAVTAD